MDRVEVGKFRTSWSQSCTRRCKWVLFVGESEDGHRHSHQVLWRHRDEKVIIIDGYEEIHIIVLA